DPVHPQTLPFLVQRRTFLLSFLPILSILKSFLSWFKDNIPFIFPPDPVHPQILPFLVQRQHSFYLSTRSCSSSNPSFPGSRQTFLSKPNIQNNIPFLNQTFKTILPSLFPSEAIL